MTEVLVTGFEPFAEHTHNPSGELARRLAATAGRAGEVLPVSYAPAEVRVRELIARHRPRIVLLLGLCADARGLRLEHQARNLDESPRPDNDGVVRCGLRIVEAGPASYPSSLPLEALAACLASQGLPVERSRDAGGYLCNHVFYAARHALASAGSDAPCGLIHVPPTAVLALDRQQRALEDCLAHLGEVGTDAR